MRNRSGGAEAALRRLTGRTGEDVRALQALANPARAAVDLAGANAPGADPSRAVAWDLRGGGRVHLRPGTEDLHVFRRTFGGRACPADRVPVRPGRVVVDVGAGVGLFSAYALWRWQAERVHAYEPDAAAYPVLEATAADSVGRIVPRRLALYRHVGSERVVPTDDAAGASWPAPPVRADTTTLPGIMDGEGIDEAELVRIAARGAEWDVLDATEDAMFERIRNLVVEAHRASPFDGRPERAVERLEALGYDVAVDASSWRTATLFATRP